MTQDEFKPRKVGKGWTWIAETGLESGATVQLNRGPRIQYYGGGYRYKDTRALNRWGRRAYRLVMHWVDPSTGKAIHVEKYLEIHKCVDVSPASYEVYEAETPDLVWGPFGGGFLVTRHLVTLEGEEENATLGWHMAEQRTLEAVVPRYLEDACIPRYKTGSECPACGEWAPTDEPPPGLREEYVFACPGCGLNFWWAGLEQAHKAPVTG